MAEIKNVDYNVLDRAKNAFIEASRKTLKFAERFGFLPNDSLGASANIFCLDLKPFLASNAQEMYITLLPEGLGTADDARPEDLTSGELRLFWRNIGYKTMSALSNDAAASGLQTVLIGLYLPSSTPELVFNEDFMSGLLDGIISACREVGCVYFSGETPQLKDKIVENRLDVAGALFALSPPGLKPVTSENLGKGDRIVFIESSGPHENGFTVLRKVAEKLPQGYRTKLPGGTEFWQAINAPSKLYTGMVQAVLSSGVRPTAIENVTGHGWQKIMRSSKNLRYVIEDMLPLTEVFSFVEKQAGFSRAELLKIFNCGVGQVIFTKDSADAGRVVQIAAEHGLLAKECGYVEEAKSREVLVKPLGITLTSEDFALKKH